MAHHKAPSKPQKRTRVAPVGSDIGALLQASGIGGKTVRFKPIKPIPFPPKMRIEGGRHRRKK